MNKFKLAYIIAIFVIIVSVAMLYWLWVYNQQIGKHKCIVQLYSRCRLPSGFLTDVRWQRHYQQVLLTGNCLADAKNINLLQPQIKHMVVFKDSINGFCFKCPNDIDIHFLIALADTCESEHVSIYGYINNGFYIVPYTYKTINRIPGKCFWL